MFGWWWQQVVGTYRCSVCGRAIHDGDNYYTPRNPDDEQIFTIERLFRVDPLAEFTACESCMGYTEFNTWLAWQLEERQEQERALSGADWRHFGF